MRNRYIFLETPGTREGGSENTYTMECGKFLDQVGLSSLHSAYLFITEHLMLFRGNCTCFRCCLLQNKKKNIFADPDADLNDPGCGFACSDRFLLI
jgi:hypothetical protein